MPMGERRSEEQLGGSHWQVQTSQGWWEGRRDCALGGRIARRRLHKVQEGIRAQGQVRGA